MHRLIVELGQYQRDRGLTHGQMARLLGIDKSTYSYINSGQREPGLKVLRAIAKQIPDLQLLVFEYIVMATSRGGPGPREGMDGRPRETIPKAQEDP